jgi:hypothetical protein
MRRFLFIPLLAVAILLLVQVITGQPLTGVPEVLRGTFAKLPELAKSTPEREYRALQTWLPERGLRGLYAKVRKNAGLAALENLSGVKVFLKGPHQKGKLNLKAKSDFGRYNPAFVRWLAIHGIPGQQDPILRRQLQPVYDKHLRRTARGFYVAYQNLKAQPRRMKQVQTRYLELLEAKKDAGDFLQETFRDDTDRYEKSDHDWYEVNVAHGFWVRRSIDGTIDEFRIVLARLLKTYDPNFLKELTKRDSHKDP